MHPAEQYLRELIYDYDCVTIPGLGGFITQSRPARLVREKRRLYPPSRIISFNSMLVHDDGLLATRIAQAEKIPYRDAAIKVKEFAGECKLKLEQYKPLYLEGIGSLVLNTDGTLRFESLPEANYAPSSYGLESILAYPHIKPEANEKKSFRPVDRKPRPKDSKSPATVRWTVSLSLPVILFLLYGIIFPASVQKMYTNYAGVLMDIYFDYKPAVPAQPFVIKAETEARAPVQITLPSEPAAEPGPEVLRVTTSSENVPALPAQKYFIIGGCFENEANAVKFKEELSGRGYLAEEAGTNLRGHVRISYKSFMEKKDALNYLDSIRSFENPSAWLLKY